MRLRLLPPTRAAFFLWPILVFLLFFLENFVGFSPVNPFPLPLTLVFAILIVGTRFDRPGSMRGGEEAFVRGDGTIEIDRVSEQ